MASEEMNPQQTTPSASTSASERRQGSEPTEPMIRWLETQVSDGKISRDGKFVLGPKK